MSPFHWNVFELETSQLIVHRYDIQFRIILQISVEQLDGSCFEFGPFSGCWIVDSRDEEKKERLDDLDDAFKVHSCRTIMNCTKACPKGLSPAKAIAGIKKELATRK